MTATENRSRTRVVITRAAEQSAELADALGGLGVEVISIPTIRIVDPADGGNALGAAVDEISGFQWLVITSPNGARRVVAGLRARHPGGVPDGVSIAAVGPGTAAVLIEGGVRVDLVPVRHLAEGLLDEFPVPTASGPADGTGVRYAGTPTNKVLVASADIARDVLADGLIAKGWDVTVVDAYRTIPVEPTSEQVDRLIDSEVITFASGSAVRALVDSVGADVIPPVVVTIGPVATAAARAAGLGVAAEADPHTIGGLVAAVAGVLP